MIKNLLFFILLLSSTTLFGQKFSGQWSGSFDAKTDTSDRTEYFLELEVNGTQVDGTSTTYFIIAGKRFYTICKVTGTFDPKSKTIVSTEVSNIKSNTPEWFRDCFQTHILTYFRKGDTEILEGNWKGARKEDNCGTGTTLLSRKQLAKNMVTVPPPVNNTVRMNPTQPKAAIKKPVTKPNTATTKTTPKQTPPVVKTKPKKDSVVKQNPTITKIQNKTETQIKPDIKSNIPAPKLPNGLERRDNKVYETIAIADEDIIVNLYDNAEIDGDIITVLFNGEVVASQKTLSDKPITLKLKAIRGKDNILTMYAENQGSIPPNTAIMRVQNGNDYYKVFLSADDKKNGSVVFRLK